MQRTTGPTKLGSALGQVRGKFEKASKIFEQGTPFSRTSLEQITYPSAILRKSPQISAKHRKGLSACCKAQKPSLLLSQAFEDYR